MKEIEIKAHLRSEEQVLDKLKGLGCRLSEPVKQVDTVYTRFPAKNVEEYMANDHFVRIRERDDGKCIFTVKKPLSREVLTKAEHETEISDVKELLQALLLMGYQVATKVIKTRRTTHYNDFEICLDEVEGMGTFIEVEKVSDRDADEVRNELNKFMELLGIPAEDQVHKGYDILAIENQQQTKFHRVT